MPPQSSGKKSRTVVTPPASTALSVFKMSAIPEFALLNSREQRFLLIFIHLDTRHHIGRCCRSLLVLDPPAQSSCIKYSM